MYLSYYHSLILRHSLSIMKICKKKIKHIEKGFQLRSCFEFNDRGAVLLIFLRLIFIGQTTCLVFIYSFLFTAPQHENHPSSVTTISTKFFFYKRVIFQTVWTVRWVTAVQRYSHLKLVVYSYYKKTSSEHTNEFFFLLPECSYCTTELEKFI